MSIIPRRYPSREAFEQARFDIFRKTEVAAARIFTTGRGIPTISIGYAIVVARRGMWMERPHWIETLKSVGVDMSRVDLEAVHALLDQVSEHLNQGQVGQAQELIPPWKPDEDCTGCNTTGIPLLKEEQMKCLFDQVITAFEDTLASRIGPELMTFYADSQELITLLSLTYNSMLLIGPGLRSALQNESRARAWYEIRYNANRSHSAAVAKRRFFEAQVLGLYNRPGDVTREEATAVIGVFESFRAKIEQYEANFGHLIHEANREFELQGDHHIQTLEEVIETARSYA